MTSNVYRPRLFQSTCDLPRHCLTLLAPKSVVFVPSGQTLQVVCPGLFWYVPYSHAAQTLVYGKWYVPIGHSTGLEKDLYTLKCDENNLNNKIYMSELSHQLNNNWHLMIKTDDENFPIILKQSFKIMTVQSFCAIVTSLQRYFCKNKERWLLTTSVSMLYLALITN